MTAEEILQKKNIYYTGPSLNIRRLECDSFTRFYYEEAEEEDTSLYDFSFEMPEPVWVTILEMISEIVKGVVSDFDITITQKDSNVKWVTIGLEPIPGVIIAGIYLTIIVRDTQDLAYHCTAKINRLEAVELVHQFGIN